MFWYKIVHVGDFILSLLRLYLFFSYIYLLIPSYRGPRGEPPFLDRCLGGQFACALMCYGVFSTIVDVTNGCLGGGCGVCFGDEKGFNVGINIKLS